MNTDFSLIIFLSFQSFFSLVRSQSPNQALIFNPQTHEIYGTWESTPEDGGPYAVACPASHTNEVIFDRQYSFNEKAIFVRYAEKNKTDQMVQKKCTRVYELSVAVHSPSNTEQFMEFGYEVYLDRTKFNVKFKESNYKNFRSIFEITSGSDYSENTRNNEAVHTMDKDENQLILANIGFVWLTKIVMKFDFASFSVKSLTYYLDKTVDKSKMDLECDTLRLGLEAYDLYFLGRYYIDYNQESILRGLKLPKSNNAGARTSNDWFEKYSLLPPYQFQTAARSRILCSDLTTIPLWYDTAKDELNYSEKFLVAVAQVADNRLKITPGVHEILAFPSITDENELKPIYLYDAKQKYPAPKIIFKIVSYQSHECKGENDLCWFDMVIVIHNQPKVNENDKLCDDNCSKWGWESIQFLSTTDRNEEKKSKNIYCCELNAEMRKLLLQSEDDFKREDFSLKKFPYYDEVDKKNEFRDMQKTIEQKMEELFAEPKEYDED